MELEAHSVKDIALEMSWHFLGFSFNSVRLFCIFKWRKKSPGIQLCHILSEWKNFYGPKSVELLRIISALCKGAQNGPQQSRITQEIIDWTPNYLNTKWKHLEQCYLQNMKVRNVLLSQKHGCSIFVCSAGIKRSYLEICRSFLIQFMCCLMTLKTPTTWKFGDLIVNTLPRFRQTEPALHLQKSYCHLLTDCFCMHSVFLVHMIDSTISPATELKLTGLWFPGPSLLITSGKILTKSLSCL